MLAGVERHGPCTDVAIFASDDDRNLIPASNTSPKPEAPEALPVELIVPAFTEPPSPSIFPDRSLPRNHPLTILRSVVLHI
jgi:hypothetical protein